jgi:hypothetical protein
LEEEFLRALSTAGADRLYSLLVSTPKSSSVLGVNSLLCLELAEVVFE